MRKFAISDIHGCKKSFEALLDKIAFSTADALYLLGDYIDRGPDSKGVIDFIWELEDAGHQVHCLRGNHEQLLLHAFEDDDEEKMNFWLANGGVATIQSFVIENGKPNIPDIYFNFLERLEHSLEVDDAYILVHAGLNFRQGHPYSDQDAMLWRRNWYDEIDREWLRGRIIVHGHTPIGKAAIEQQLENLSDLPVVNIDGGCVFANRRPNLGDLCAFELTERTLHFQKNIDD